MKKVLSYVLLLIPCSLFAQDNAYLGINLPALLINTADFRFERQVTSKFAFQMGMGFRLQSRDSTWDPGFKPIGEFSNLKNHAAYLAVGGRLFDEPPRFNTDFPYVSFEWVGAYYNETFIQRREPLQPQIVEAKGVKWGVSVQAGFVTEITKRLYLDVALQVGYSAPRPDLLGYYIPNLGYTLFGIDLVSIKGAHFQPIITAKYLLKKDKRRRIRERQ